MTDLTHNHLVRYDKEVTHAGVVYVLFRNPLADSWTWVPKTKWEAAGSPEYLSVLMQHLDMPEEPTEEIRNLSMHFGSRIHQRGKPDWNCVKKYIEKLKESR